MARGASISDNAALTGDIGLIIALNHMKAASARRIMRPAVRAALTPVLKSAKKNVKTDSKKLKKAIKKKVGKARAGGVNGMIYVSKTQDSPGDRPSLYGIFQEFGTKHMAPNPFMRKAMSDNKAAVKRIMVTKGRERLRVEARKARARGRTL